MSDNTRAPKPIAPKDTEKHLFCFGYGYVAEALAEHLKLHGWKVSGTTTDPNKAINMAENGIKSYVFDQNMSLCDPYGALKDVTHILVSIPPANFGDVVLDMHEDDIEQLKNIEWVGYLSSTSVYGNQDGGKVDETCMPAPTSQRGSLRLKSELQWEQFQKDTKMPLHIFRLAGIYGPGRSALDAVRAGNSRRIEKPGHAFNRIHLDDIVQVLTASINQPKKYEIYNLADDNPAPSHEVIAYACTILGMDVPPLIPFETVEMAPIVRSFYADNKRVKNDKIKQELNVELLHPDYRSGLNACYEAEEELAEMIEDI